MKRSPDLVTCICQESGFELRRLFIRSNNSRLCSFALRQVASDFTVANVNAISPHARDRDVSPESIAVFLVLKVS